MTRCICSETTHDEACPVCIAGEPDIDINVKVITDREFGGEVYLPVKHLEWEDDGSITAIASLPDNLRIRSE